MTNKGILDRNGVGVSVEGQRVLTEIEVVEVRAKAVRGDFDIAGNGAVGDPIAGIPLDGELVLVDDGPAWDRGAGFELDGVEG